MLYVAHSADRTPAEPYGYGATAEEATSAARRQFAGAMQFWPAVKRRLVISEVPDGFQFKEWPQDPNA